MPEESKFSFVLDLEPGSSTDAAQMLLNGNDFLLPTWNELEALPTRLLPIAVVSSVESQLTELMASYLLEGNATDKLLGITNNPAENGIEYVPRIRLGSALGLLPSNMAEAMEILGRIRNHFAHKPAPSVTDDYMTRSLSKLTRLLITVLVTALVDDEKSRERIKDSYVREFNNNSEVVGRFSLRFAWLILTILVNEARKELDGTRLEAKMTWE